MKKRLAITAWLCFWFVFVYNGCNYLASLRTHVGTLAFAWELRWIPFWPIFIVAYWSEDLFFVAAPWFCRSDRLLTQHLRRITTGIAIAGIFFLLFPLQLAFQRPTVPGGMGRLFTSLEVMNNFYNCCPSLHIVLRTLLWPVYIAPLAHRGARWLLGAWFFAIALSTLVCWQHHIIDVYSGQLLGIFCLYLYPLEVLPQVSFRPRPSIGHRYLAGALLVLVWMLWGWPLTFPLLWPLTSLGLVAWAYYRGGPNVMQKLEGRQRTVARWLLNPYRWGSQLTAAYFNAGHPAYQKASPLPPPVSSEGGPPLRDLPPPVSSEGGPPLRDLPPPVSSEGGSPLRDLPPLWVGRRLSQAEALAMPAEAVLDLTAEYDEVPAFLERRYRNIPILDLTAPSLAQLEEGVEFLRQNPNCYIHCSLGLGRSITFLVAYRMHQGLSLKEALEEARKVQPRLRLGLHNLEVLQEFATRGANGGA